MDWPATLVLTACVLALTVFCGWAGSRPPDLRRGPRLAPYRLLMVMGAAGLLLMVVHILNLAGVTTGR